MQGVTSNANPDNSEVIVRSPTSIQESKATVSATGRGHIPAAAATGKLKFVNHSDQSYALAKGTPIQPKQKPSIEIFTDEFVLIPAGTPGYNGVITVKAHVEPAGEIGNSSSDILIQACCRDDNTIEVTMDGDFTGGRDAEDYNFVQDNDMKAAITNSRLITLKSNAENDIKGQIKADELWGGINCDDPKTTPDRPIGDNKVDTRTVNITVSLSCKGEVLEQISVQNVFKQKAMKAGYVLASKMVVEQVQAYGNMTFSVTVSGLWHYNWTNADRQALLNKIKGKDRAQALTILNSDPGVDKTNKPDIIISNGGTDLPNDVTQIRIEVKTVNGP
jgi:hypothetical protein